MLLTAIYSLSAACLTCLICTGKKWKFAATIALGTCSCHYRSVSFLAHRCHTAVKNVVYVDNGVNPSLYEIAPNHLKGERSNNAHQPLLYGRYTTTLLL